MPAFAPKNQGESFARCRPGSCTGSIVPWPTTDHSRLDSSNCSPAQSSPPQGAKWPRAPGPLRWSLQGHTFGLWQYAVCSLMVCRAGICPLYLSGTASGGSCPSLPWIVDRPLCRHRPHKKKGSALIFLQVFSSSLRFWKSMRSIRLWRRLSWVDECTTRAR
jgi:hypothetical protein